MKRSYIIFAIISIISIISTLSFETFAQKARRSAGPGVQQARPARVGNIRVAVGDVNNDGLMGRRRTGNNLIVNGQGGNDQIGALNRRPSTSLVQGNQIGTDRRSSVSGNTAANGNFSRRVNGITFEGNDEPLWARSRRNSGGQVNAAASVGPQINGNVRPKGTGIVGDFDHDNPAIANRSSNRGGNTQLLSAGTYGRGNRRSGNLTGLSIP